MEKRFASNTVTSNALIHGLCDAGNVPEAVRILKEMLEQGLQLDKITYNTTYLSVL